MNEFVPKTVAITRVPTDRHGAAAIYRRKRPTVLLRQSRGNFTAAGYGKTETFLF